MSSQVFIVEKGRDGSQVVIEVKPFASLKKARKFIKKFNEGAEGAALTATLEKEEGGDV